MHHRHKHLLLVFVCSRCGKLVRTNRLGTAQAGLEQSATAFFWRLQGARPTVMSWNRAFSADDGKWCQDDDGKWWQADGRKPSKQRKQWDGQWHTGEGAHVESHGSRSHQEREAIRKPLLDKIALLRGELNVAFRQAFICHQPRRR